MGKDGEDSQIRPANNGCQTRTNKSIFAHQWTVTKHWSASIPLGGEPTINTLQRHYQERIKSPLRLHQRLEGGTCVHVYIAMKSKREVHIQSNTLALEDWFLNISLADFSNFSIGGFVAGTTPVTHISSFSLLIFQGRVGWGRLQFGRSHLTDDSDIISLVPSVGNITIQHMIWEYCSS